MKAKGGAGALCMAAVTVVSIYQIWFGGVSSPFRHPNSKNFQYWPTKDGQVWTASPYSPVVAFAISLTSLEGSGGSSILDAAEVLLVSIRRACQTSVYNCEAIAFVLPSIPRQGRFFLSDIGWRLEEKDLPIQVEDIEAEFLRGHINKTGCCGASELIKLHAYTLTEYHRVVHLDVDTMVTSNIDELIDMNASLVYTTDPAMNTRKSRAPPVQGGFLLTKPDLSVYEELVAIVRKGNWKLQTGWEGSNIGYFWGGATIQGLLAYYYTDVAEAAASIEVDRCVYNHMADTPACQSARYAVFSSGFPRTGEAMGLAGADQEARGKGAEMGEEGGVRQRGTVPGPEVVKGIKIVHFTDHCLKPWLCARSKRETEACVALIKLWLDSRAEVMRARGLEEMKACTWGDLAQKGHVRGTYHSIERDPPPS